MARRLSQVLLFALAAQVGLALTAQAQEAPASAPVSAPESGPPVDPAGVRDRGFLGMFLYWSGAVVVMALVGRVLFREQLHERRTLTLMRDQLGKFFPEFDPVAITEWVQRAAPHLWKGWRDRALGDVEAFTTEAFRQASEAAFAEARRHGHAREAKLGKVLKVHMLGLYPAGDGPPPRDMELVLRVESRGTDCVRDPDGRVLAGKEGPRQVQQFWTLRHDGERWRLHGLEPATEDRTDLAGRPPVPPLMEWRRPEASA
ncbi:MAG: TIM44-like domain-containing protein [Myxococcales bacterium]|nr:TIM44-like domain-containing protein [Myxococcales bacterium]